MQCSPRVYQPEKFQVWKDFGHKAQKLRVTFWSQWLETWEEEKEGQWLPDARGFDGPVRLNEGAQMKGLPLPKASFEEEMAGRTMHLRPKAGLSRCGKQSLAENGCRDRC